MAEWISVDDMMPRKECSVAGWFVGESLPDGEICFCMFSPLNGFCDEDGDLNDFITHWMPLPEPPK